MAARPSRASRLVPASAAALLALVALGSPRDASALGSEVGGFGGPELRTKTELGDTFGLFGGISISKEIPLAIEVYYQHSGLQLERRTPENNTRKVRLDIIGGRFRYLFTVVTRLHPFLSAGMGYAHASYPGVVTGQSNDIANGSGLSIVSRSGGFAEVPVGGGLGIDAGKHIRVNIEALLRPGFAFGGDAYKVQAIPAEDKLKLGVSITGGIALWF